jgi:hypothetical protein
VSCSTPCSSNLQEPAEVASASPEPSTLSLADGAVDADSHASVAATRGKATAPSKARKVWSEEEVRTIASLC